MVTQDILNIIFSCFSACITWLTTLKVLGVPILYYLVAVAIISIVMRALLNVVKPGRVTSSRRDKGSGD